MVALTEAGHGVKTVAQVFGVHPNYLSTLRKTAREQGSTGLVKAMGRPVKLSLAQLRQAQRWVGQGVSGQEIARRLQVSDTMISRLVGGRRRPELVQDELPDPELPDPRCRHRSRAGSGRAGPGRRAARAGRARARWRAGRGGAGGRARGVRAAG